MEDSHTKSASASLAAIRRYLQLKGWNELKIRSETTSLFTLAIEDNKLELPLPRRRDFDGSERLIADALRTLSQLTDRDTTDVLDDINSIGFDRVRSIIPDELVQSDSIDLNIASGFIINAKRLITTVATTELEPSTFFGRVTKDAQTYTDRCRFGHTFRGSFGFTIESPLIQNNEPPLPGVPEQPPFERRVIQRLVRGLRDIKTAEVAENPGLVAEKYQTGFNANMCDALIELVEKTSDRLKIQVAWSPEWLPSSDVEPTPSFSIGPATVELLHSAAASLRRVEAARPVTMVGAVIRLKSEHNPADLLDVSSPREIVVQWNSLDFGPLNVRVNLSPADYIMALEAHRVGRPISVTGKLERINRTWILSSPGNVAVTRYPAS